MSTSPEGCVRARAVPPRLHVASALANTTAFDQSPALSLRIGAADCREVDVEVVRKPALRRKAGSPGKLSAGNVGSERVSDRKVDRPVPGAELRYP